MRIGRKKGYRLKGKHYTRDRRLDRLAQFDERSRDYPIRALISAPTPRSYTWGCGVVLDQGTEGACTGFSTAHELASRPAPCPVDVGLAQRIYKRAKQIDEWPGDKYEGSSVLAAVKAATEDGYFKEYRWAFGLNDLALAVGRKGPAILGINWYEGMYRPDENGFLRVTGDQVGGHAILCRGVRLIRAGGHLDPSRSYFLLHNSWGADWGNNGTAKLTFEDMDRLLKEDGDACIPVTRVQKKTTC